MDYEPIFLTAAVAASLALGAPAVRATEPYPRLDARVRAVAEQGPDALRHFVFRTRMIYSLDVHDYAPPEATDPADDLAPEGFWTGVQAFEARPDAWLHSAGSPAAAEFLTARD
jgi:hypothetical protein